VLKELFILGKISAKREKIKKSNIFYIKELA